VKFIDVGQGDAIFIRSIEGNTMLIDGGENSEGDRALNQEMFFPFCHLDYLLVTHPHADHIRGLEKVLKRCSVGLIMFNDVSTASASLDRFRQLVKKNNVINTYVGDEFNFGKGKIKILWPPRELTLSGIKNLNDLSTVVFLDYGDFEGLFLGDLQGNNQVSLDISGIKNLIDGRLEVIKIAHHGSSNGVYLPVINDLKPSTCVISVGSDNKFGHPNASSVLELGQAGCEVLRTDFLGDVVIKKN
jgi:beta-lactamase superfamily II metal-dependent hydrolase